MNGESFGIMSKKKYIKILNEIHKIPNKNGNGILKYLVSVDEKGKLARYSLSYINPRLCHLDNGRVLGYDNNHGHHHRHFMGREEPVNFRHYEEVAKKFEREWRKIHEKAQKS